MPLDIGPNTVSKGLFVISFATLIMSIIVVGVVADKMEEFVGDQRLCYFENTGRHQACDGALAIGTISLFLALMYSVAHFVEVRQLRTYAIVSTQGALIVRAAAAGFAAFVWMIAFGVMVNDWNKSSFNNSYSDHQGPARTAMAFAYLCFMAWLLIIGGSVYILRVFPTTYYSTFKASGGGGGRGGGDGESGVTSGDLGTTATDLPPQAPPSQAPAAPEGSSQAGAAQDTSVPAVLQPSS